MKVCIVTPGQPSNNPRVVKEADALTEAGHTVHVLCADCGLWPFEMDPGVMASRRWTMEYAGGSVADQPLGFRVARLRHRIGRHLLTWMPTSALARRWAPSRATPPLAEAAGRHSADLYIAHHPAVLDAAVDAATKYGSAVAYDIEDLYSAMYPVGCGPSELDQLIEQIEADHLPSCAYVTAASPAFADAYADKYGIPAPTPVLNVFPLSERPDAFRPTSLEEDPVHLYWFSQVLGSGRGLEDVLQALGMLRRMHCRFELHLRGSWMPGYRQKLFACASSAGVPHDAIFVYPPAPPGEMVRLAAQFDVGLCVEQSENRSRPLGITNKTFVSLLAGNAIASTNMQGQHAVLDVVGPAAFSYEPGNVPALAAGLKVWHDDRRALDRARRTAWDWGTRRYNWDVEKRTFLAAVEAGVMSYRSARARAAS